jgi:hypothetical protein
MKRLKFLIFTGLTLVVAAFYLEVDRASAQQAPMEKGSAQQTQGKMMSVTPSQQEKLSKRNQAAIEVHNARIRRDELIRALSMGETVLKTK